MRRLLTAIACLGLMLVLAAPALAAGRVPSGVTRVSVALTAPPASAGGSHASAHRTFTRAAKIAEIVNATDALKVATARGACPMIMVLGPHLTVVFRNSGGTIVAEETVQVVYGSKGDSGSSNCFPIHFSSGSTGQSLVGNSFIRTIGRMIGTPIS